MLPFKGKYPKLEPKSHAMPGAELAGDVELKEYASVWQNVSARGDVNKIVVGRYSNVQDNSVLHVDDDHACILGDFVTIGHSAIIQLVDHTCHIISTGNLTYNLNVLNRRFFENITKWSNFISPRHVDINISKIKVLNCSTLSFIKQRSF